MALLTLLVLALGATAGCGHMPGWSRHQPPSTLERADILYAEGEYAPAAEAYHQHLSRHPEGRSMDRVLLRLATIHLLPESPLHDTEAGVFYLDRLIAERPESSLAEPARLLRDLQTRIEVLEEQDEEQRERLADLSQRLEALKRIDLERSREPPPR